MATTAPKIRFDHVNISVADLEAQHAWYEAALGFAKVVERVELEDPPVRTVVLEAPGGDGLRPANSGFMVALAVATD